GLLAICDGGAGQPDELPAPELHSDDVLGCRSVVGRVCALAGYPERFVSPTAADPLQARSRSQQLHQHRAAELRGISAIRYLIKGALTKSGSCDPLFLYGLCKLSPNAFRRLFRLFFYGALGAWQA